MEIGNGYLKGVKAKANGVNGHVNGKANELNGSINSALNGVKSQINGNDVVPRRKTTSTQQRGFLARGFSIIARIVTWYSIFVLLFRCPSNLESCDETSPRICKPYFQVKQAVRPHLEPYYNTYAAPYVTLAQPYYNTVDQRVITPGWGYATKYATPQVLMAQTFGKAQWEKSVHPQVQKYQSLAKSQYDQNLAPHVHTVSSAVGPYYDIARTNALQTYHELLLPSYKFLHPYAQKGFTVASSFTTDTAIPSAVLIWNKTYHVLEEMVWPHIRTVYVENVEPQLAKIGQRLGRYHGEKKLSKTVTKAATTAIKAASSFTKPTPSVSSTVIASASVSTTLTATTQTSQTQATIKAPQATPETTLSKGEHIQAPEWVDGEQEDAVRRSARETVAADLRDWQERYAKAADEGAIEIENRVDEIAKQMIDRNARETGKSTLEQLQTTVVSELVTLRRDILNIVGAVGKGSAKPQEGQEQLAAVIRRSGMAIKDKAQEIRTWRENYETELHEAVTTAAGEHFKTLDTIRDLAVQKIGMKWAWTDGITYRDWQKYHLLKDRFDEWHGDLEKLIVTHPGLEAAQLEGSTIEEEAMKIASSAAKELARLKQVGNWKLTAADTSDEFDSGLVEQAAIAAQKAKDTAAQVAGHVKDKAASFTESVYEAVSDASSVSLASATVESAASAATRLAQSGTSSGASVASSLFEKASSVVGETVVPSARSVISQGTRSISSATKLAKSVASEGTEAATSAIESVTDVAPSIAGKASSSASSATKVASSVADKAARSAKSVVSEGTDTASSVVESAIKSASCAAGKASDSAVNGASSIKSAASGISVQASESVINASSTVKSAASSVAGKAAESASSATESASSIAEEASKSGASGASSIKSAASSVGGKASSSVTSAAKAAPNIAGEASKSVQSASSSVNSAVSQATEASSATNPDLASAATEEIIIETPVFVRNTAQLHEDFPALIELPVEGEDIDEPEVVDEDASDALHLTTTTIVKSAWFGAAAQSVPTRVPIMDDDSFDIAASVMSSIRNEMPSQFSTLAQSAYSNAVSRANAQYSQALSAVSVQIHGTPKPAHEQLLASVTSAYGNAMASASSRLEQALKAASGQFVATPSHSTVNILPTAMPAIPHPTVPSVDWKRIESIASEKLANGKAWAEGQYEAAKVRVGPANPTPSTPSEHVDKLLENAKHNYYAGLGVAYARYSEFLSAASSAVSSMTATPTPTDFAGTVSSLASLASESAASVAAAAGENASAAGSAASASAGSAASYASASAASVASLASLSAASMASVASASASSAASVVGENVSSVAAAGYEGASAGYDKASSAASVVAENAASVASSGYDNAASAAFVVGENASSVAAAGYDAAASGYESVASAAGAAADTVAQNWDGLVSQLSVRVYGAPTPTPWYESIYSVLGEYASSVTEGASSVTSGAGSYATVASTQAAEQYHVVSSIISELVIGKEPSFTDSVYSRLNAAYKTGAASAASLASVAQESAASGINAASEAVQSAGDKVASVASEPAEAVKSTGHDEL